MSSQWDQLNHKPEKSSMSSPIFKHWARLSPDLIHRKPSIKAFELELVLVPLGAHTQLSKRIQKTRVPQKAETRYSEMSRKFEEVIKTIISEKWILIKFEKREKSFTSKFSQETKIGKIWKRRPLQLKTVFSQKWREGQFEKSLLS